MIRAASSRSADAARTFTVAEITSTSSPTPRQPPPRGRTDFRTGSVSCCRNFASGSVSRCSGRTIRPSGCGITTWRSDRRRAPEAGVSGSSCTCLSAPTRREQALPDLQRVGPCLAGTGRRFGLRYGWGGFGGVISPVSVRWRATSRSFRFRSWDEVLRMSKALSGVVLSRSIRIALAWPITSRARAFGGVVLGVIDVARRLGGGPYRPIAVLIRAGSRWQPRRQRR